MSSPLRIELRRARVLPALLVLLAALAGLALWLSALPRWSLALTVPLLALSWPRPRGPVSEALVLRGDGSAVEIAAGEEHELRPLRLQRRGPLTVLEAARDGRPRRFVFLPDTLDAPTRRALALWFGRHVSSPGPKSPVAHV